MDTKLKADIAESATTTELLARGFNVLRPVGDRLSYDLLLEKHGKYLRIQVKSVWFNKLKNLHMVDNRRTCTNRRTMLRKTYQKTDFDFAILYLQELKIFYIMPIDVFNSYASCIPIVESDKRQRKPKSMDFRERWDLLEAMLERI